MDKDEEIIAEIRQSRTELGNQTGCLCILLILIFLAVGPCNSNCNGHSQASMLYHASEQVSE
jgi:hypothetical protein